MSTHRSKLALSVSARYPAVAWWIENHGWIEVGYDQGGSIHSFVRALDGGGMVWEGKDVYATLDDALDDLEEGLGRSFRKELGEELPERKLKMAAERNLSRKGTGASKTKRSTKTTALSTSPAVIPPGRLVSKKSPPRSRTAKTPMPSPMEISAMIDEATVDAYGEEEQASGWHTMLENNLALPFSTEVLGVEVEVTQLDLTGGNEIVAVCQRGKHEQRVPILDLPLPDPLPKGSAWIEAYRQWRR